MEKEEIKIKDRINLKGKNYQRGKEEAIGAAKKRGVR